MIFFKEKTVTLGRCSADMQEWLAKEIMRWLDDKTLNDIEWADGIIYFHEATSASQLWPGQNPMKCVGYGEIHFLQQDDGIEVIAKLRPSLLSKIGLCFGPVFIVVFSLIWLSDGKLTGIWLSLILPIFIIISLLNYFDTGPDDLLKQQVRSLIALKQYEQKSRAEQQ